MLELSTNIFKSLRPFEVDLKHLMEDIKDHYSYPIEEAVIVENMDNCIDENYDEIHFNIRNGTLEIIMLGDSFTEEAWKILPKIAATTKTKGRGKYALGRYGWGLKVCMYVGEYVIIESRDKSKDFHEAQRWIIHEGIPKWGKEPVKKPPINDKYTRITIKLNDEYVKVFTKGFIEKTLQKFYPTVLGGAKVKNKLGIKRKLEVYVNSSKVKQQQLRWEKRKCLKATIGREEATGYIYLAKKKLPEEFKGIAVIVHGRVILRDFFGVHGPLDDRITGYIHADMLINHLAGDKTKIRRNCKEWRKLKEEIAKQLRSFMKEVGAVIEGRLPKKTLKWVNEELNKLLKRIPEFQELAIKCKVHVSRKVLIQKDKGDKPVTLVEGAQKVPGTEKGPGEGNNVPAWIGTSKLKSPQLNDYGKDRAVYTKRKVRIGIEIRPTPSPKTPLEAWYSPEGVIYVNTSFPSYKKAEKLGFRDYHILRCSIEALLKYALKDGKISIEEYENYSSNVFAKWGEL